MERCHVCRGENPDYLRFQIYICETCRKYPVLNSNGHEMNFYNKGVMGGFLAKNTITDEISEDHICYINGAKCWADEYRFGGILIAGFEYKDSSRF